MKISAEHHTVVKKQGSRGSAAEGNLHRQIKIEGGKQCGKRALPRVRGVELCSNAPAPGRRGQPTINKISFGKYNQKENYLQETYLKTN